MSERGQGPGYFQGLNGHLLAAVPDEAVRILEVGCAEGMLGARLKEGHPHRTVVGVEREPAAVAVARTRLDAVYELDLELTLPPVEDGLFDCIIYGDVLEHLIDPWTVLRRHRPLLAPGGSILCSIPNIQHHAALRQILRGDFQYRARGLLDETHLRFFTYATVSKMLLDAGFEPRLVDTIDIGGGDGLIDAARAVLDEVRVDPVRAARFMTAQQLIVTGRPMVPPTVDDVPPLTFVACVNDEDQLASNLLRSPCLRDGGPHEVLLYRGCTTAAEGLNRGIDQASNDLVVLVHQDVYLPDGWPDRLVDQWRRAARDHVVGIAGVFGSRQDPGLVEGREHSDARGHVGRIVDRDHLHDTSGNDAFPAVVDYLDELLMVVPRTTPLRVDPSLGWHLYGTDLCLQAAQAGLATVVLDALCMHNSLSGPAGDEYRASEEVVARKWHDRLPVHTTISSVYGPPERRRMERIEAERDAAVAGLKQAEAERDAAVAELVQVGHDLDLVEGSRTWRVRKLVARTLGRH
jgi:2-polyprenyl-3-methyl-5-hydroxy-6-metoxy-1,4-benzoquinol methylase